MRIETKFCIHKLKGSLAGMRDWLAEHHCPPRILLFIMGIASTVWFLIRVIPKPSRATYPCMQVAAPAMSGFIVYLLSISGISLAFRRARHSFRSSAPFRAILFGLAAVAALGTALYQGSQTAFSNQSQQVLGPDDGPNQPFGKALGIFPGRVVWAWNPDATNEKCTNSLETADYYFKPENTNSQVVAEMLRASVMKLGGKPDVSSSWDSFFRYLNRKKYNRDSGYTKGEKIFIKINQGTSRWLLSQEEKNAGYHMPGPARPEETKWKQSIPPTETNPWVVLEILRQLVNSAGVDQKDIAVGDPMTDMYAHNYDIWHKEFPDVTYTSKLSDRYGRTIINPSKNDLLFYSDKTQSDKLFDLIEQADYLINIANFKPHVAAGISLTAKNHFGSQARESAMHLHYALMGARGGRATNGGYGKYRVQVDLMGSKYLGQNTVLYLVDGLFGGGASETKPPVKYFMAPFNDDWSSSIFMSLDQVALESVCYDFLRTEWNGVNKHNPVNSNPEISPSYNGVDDYLHQAADPSRWPAGIRYDPDGKGNPVGSLGVHEHWNNPGLKQYSGNLGLKNGIELVSIPADLIRSGKPN